MRKSTTYFAFLTGLTLCVMLTAIDASLRQKGVDNDLQLRSQLVKDLGLTDLALFTEARYTRHLSQADLHTAFQDHPMGMEHFPSGSLVLPPRHLLQPASQGEN